MPKIVDHQERRAELSRVILRTIAKEGLENLTIRRIVKEGGFSSGSLAHYFTNKNEMINFAFGAVADEAYAKIDERLAKCATGMEKLRVVIEEHLPDSAGNVEAATSYAAVCLAFWSNAVHDHVLANRFEDIYERWRRYLRLALEEVFAGEQIVQARTLDDTIDMIIAMTDGLLVSYTISPKNFPRVKRDHMINVLLAGVVRDSNGNKNLIQAS
jgi:AcrR family transcriptional regulator